MLVGMEARVVIRRMQEIHGLRWKNFNLVRRFSILSAVYTCGLAVALGLLITNFLARDILHSAASITHNIAHRQIRHFSQEELTPAEFEKHVMTEISFLSDLLILDPEILRVKIYNTQGVIIWSDESKLIGTRVRGDARFDRALAGYVVEDIEKTEGAAHIYEKAYKKVFEIYLPISNKAGETVAVLELYKLPEGTWDTIRATSLLVWLIVFAGGGALYLALLGVVRTAYRRQLALEEESGESERLLNTSFNAMDDAIAVIGADSKIIDANGAALRMFGRGVVGCDFATTLRGYGSLRLDSQIKRTMKDKESSRWEAYDDGTKRYWDARCYPVQRPDGELSCVVVIMRDISEYKRLEDALRASEQSFQAIVAKTPTGILIVDKRGTIQYANPTAEIFLNRRADELLGNPLGFTVAEGVRSEIEIGRREGGKGVADVRVVETVWKEEPVYLVSLRDITEIVRLREELHNLSMTDDLTGLNNRRGFLQLAQQHLNLAKRTRSEVLLIFLDLNGLKNINDSLGHSEGDQALVDMAYLLRKTFRESDIIGRIGGDEFTVLASDTGGASAGSLTGRLQNNLEAHNLHGGRRYKLSISVGVAYYDYESDRSIEDLLVKADASMYEQKRRLKNS